MIYIYSARVGWTGPGKPASVGDGHGRARGRGVPDGEGGGAPPGREARDALRLREPRRAPQLPSGDQAPAALPPRGGRGAAPPGPERRPERQGDPAAGRAAAERPADPARRVVDPRLRRAAYISPRPDLGAAVELARRAEAADFRGAHYRVGWSAALPRRPAPPRVYLAALSRRMLELAGELADGAILWLCLPAYVRDVAIPALGRGRRRAGKSMDGFEIVAAVPLAVTGDPAAARRAVTGELARYLALPFYRAMLEASGLGEGVRAFDRDRAVPDALADALGAVGDAARARAYVAAYRAAGVPLPAIRPLPFPHPPRYGPTLEAAASL